MKVPHESARAHVTGEAVYIDDRVEQANEVFVEIVGAPIRKGLLKNLDFSEAVKIPGILGFISAKDIHYNLFGNIVADQPLLVESQIEYIDEPLALLVGTSARALAKAKVLVKIECVEEKPIINLDQAIAEDATLYTATPLSRGNVLEALEKSDHRLQGFFENGGQEHFYLESQAAIAYPLESGQIEVHSSTQHPTETQHVVAHALGINFSDVVCVVKRMGGGFGGKESQAAPFAAYAALAAKKFSRPARVVISKDEDMKITGKRHPFKTRFDVGFTHEGTITALKFFFYADAGAYTDLSPSILDRALFHGDSCYYVENVLFEGKALKTNTHSNTAFRGFGGPQGALAMEVVMDKVADFLRMDPFELRIKNLYQKDTKNITPYGQKVNDVLLPEIFHRLRVSSHYDNRKNEIENFNKKNGRFKRALGVCGVKFGIAFTAKFLNQGNALVHLHRDGSIQVSTGGTEMGQGLNTKIAQVVAQCLGRDVSQVKVMPTSTDKNANTSPTAASSGTDINAKAASLAALKIAYRLKYVASLIFAKQLPQNGEEIELPLEFPDLSHLTWTEGGVRDQNNNEIAFQELINTCYFHRLSLSEYAFFKTPDLSFDKKTGKGNPFFYFTLGAAISEVEVDASTGQYKVLRADLLMDLGRPINHGIDRGQVAGAYIQGMGWLTSEALYYSNEGRLLSHSPTTYKIPNIQDTPRVFNIQFLENDQNQKNIQGSKAVGEPPFLLSHSVFLAIENAVRAFGNEERGQLHAPATPERVYFAIHPKREEISEISK